MRLAPLGLPSLLWLALSCSPQNAAAQSFFVFEAPIAPEGDVLGSLHDAPVTVVRWATPTEPVLQFEDADVSLETSVELAESMDPARPRARLVAGVRGRTTLPVGPWTIRMSAGAWAPVRGADAAGVRIALPPGMPSSEATIPLGTRGARGRPSRAFDHPEASSRGFELVCASFEVRASAAPDAPRWTIPSTAAYRVRRVNEVLTIEVRMEGFVLLGFVDRVPDRCDAELGRSGIGSSCGDGFTNGLVFQIPAGTPLYASSSSTEPFARARREIVGREILQTPRALACRTVPGETPVCEPSPPEPRGHTTLLFVGEGSASWSFHAEVRLPVETLARATGVGGFGGCRVPLSDWPPGSTP